MERRAAAFTADSIEICAASEPFIADADALYMPTPVDLNQAHLLLYCAAATKAFMFAWPIDEALS